MARKRTVRKTSRKSTAKKSKRTTKVASRSGTNIYVVIDK